MSRFRRIAFAVPVLVLVLAAPVLAAQRKPPVRPDLVAMAAQAWHRLTAPLVSLWAKGGGGMDPDGKPLPNPAPATSDGGSPGTSGGAE
jgi:hypothetical protein